MNKAKGKLLTDVPTVWLPKETEPGPDWLTRSEFAALLWELWRGPRPKLKAMETAAAGIQRITPHTLKHTAITLAIQSGMAAEMRAITSQHRSRRSRRRTGTTARGIRSGRWRVWTTLVAVLPNRVRQISSVF